MPRPKIQIGDEVREMTDTEHAEYQQMQTDLASIQAEHDAKNNNRAAAKQAVLDKLGLTADEAAALLG